MFPRGVMMGDHSHAAKVRAHGEVVCALDELLLIAAERWRTPFSQHALASACGVSPTTINQLTPLRARALGAVQETVLEEPRRQRVALRTVAAICGVLICLPGELLRYRAPNMTLPRLGPGAVRRTDPPPEKVSVIYPITNRLPKLLQPYTPAALAHATGISWATWKRAKAETRHIDFDTLAAACAVLGCDVGAILQHRIPFRTSLWRIRSVQFDTHRITFDLSNSVTMSALIGQWQSLLHASPAERLAWRLNDNGQSVRWDALDVEISPRLLLD